MKIKQFEPIYQNEAVSLILDIQNNEAKINLSLKEQPDLLDINKHYIATGGNFWIAVDDDNHVIGTIALMKKDIPTSYRFPDRNSLLYRLDISAHSPIAK